MAPRYLFGPVSVRFFERNLKELSSNGDCFPFDTRGRLPFFIKEGDSWGTILQRLPADWRPEFVVLDLDYTTIPHCLWNAPVPLIGLAPDWNLLWHGYRHSLKHVDLVLTDTEGVEHLGREGIDHAIAANLFGLEDGWLTSDPPEEDARDIDILFVGNLHPAVQRERLAWLGKLASMGERWNVAIHQGVFDESYRNLVRRARIVFNRSIRRECNMRAFEAVAAGALLFQEADNREAAAFFRDRQECVYYDEQTLVPLLEQYLEQTSERLAIVIAARERIGQYTFANFWGNHLVEIQSRWPSVQARAKTRIEKAEPISLNGRVWQAVGSSFPTTDSELVEQLTDASSKNSSSPDLENSLGIAMAVAMRDGGMERIGEAFVRASRTKETHLIANLNLAEALAKAGKREAAIHAGQRALQVLDEESDITRQTGSRATDKMSEPAWLDAPHFAHGFDLFRVEWERAAWGHAGNREGEIRAKRNLIRWRIHQLLAEQSKELRHYYEAALARPDLPTSRAALGCALARAGQPALAIRHLRDAVGQNPFDLAAARALFQALRDSGDELAQQRLANERRLLAKAAPCCVPIEHWFNGTTGSGPVQRQESHVPAQSKPLNIIWEGDHKELHSLAIVNRAICSQLVKRGHKLAAIPSAYSQSAEKAAASTSRLLHYFENTPSRTADSFIRHQWPPRFIPPPMGHWIMMQPWEFGSLPCSWIEPMREQVDEIWVPSNSVRQCYIDSGVPADRVQVIPLGVNSQTFHPEVTAFPLRTRKRFKFLFVGGSIHRKGIDVLLKVYTNTFTEKDDVCLVIKDMGSHNFYRGLTSEELLSQLRRKPGAPEIEYHNSSLSTEQIAGLYTACDCLVHPFRGEGFGLPIVEAMGCGLPVIVTGSGPTRDFCTDATAYLIPAKKVYFPEKMFNDEATVDYPWLVEPDPAVLQQWMRRVFHAQEEAYAKGRSAMKHITENFTWARAAERIVARLQALREQPIRRELANRQPANSNLPRLRSTITLSASLHKAGITPRPFLSACLIVKNEEDNLADCLRSIEGVADELIVVDTGSQDRTKEIAREFGAAVFDFPWVDSFAAARNECLRHATGEWIFWLDADDRVDADNRERLRDVVDGLRTSQAAVNAKQSAPFDAYVMTCRCLSNREDGTITEVQHVRLFRNHPQLRWEHRIHEQILPAVRRMGGVPRFTDVVVEHVGYQDPNLRVRKRERDLRLLQIEHAELPDHPFNLFNLGMTYLDLKRAADALPLLQRSLDRSAPTDSIVRKLYYMIVQCYRQMDKKDEALNACRKGREVYPQDAELLAQEGLLLNDRNDLAGAEECYLQLLNDRESPHFSSVPVGLNGYLTRHNLAVVYLRQNKLADAEAQWRIALQEKPVFESAWLGLEDLYVKQGRWDDLEALTIALEQQPTLKNQAVIARARGHLARREFESARMLLEGLISREPNTLRPRMLLSHILLKEGRDPAAAEQVLRDVLGLDPGNLEAKRNLSLLKAARAHH